MRKIIPLLAFLIVGPAYGGNCKWVVAPTSVVLGSYSVFSSAPLFAVSSYSFSCTPNTEGTLTFSTGSNSTGYFPRYLSSAGGVKIPYNLYDDAATTIVIGNGSGGTTSRVVFNSEPKDKRFDDTVYGKVIQGADVPAGTYTDSVTAFLSWGNGSVSATILVTTTVLAECTMSAAAVAFGNYDPVVANATAPLDSTGSIDVFCTKNTSATVSLGNGLWGARRMRSPAGSFLNYGLFTDSGRSSSWLAAAPNVVSGSSTSKLVPIGNGLTVYGRVPGNQDPTAGVHSDTVQATVNY